MRITKDQKAITLIALVITIIVLLILAGVALATLTGNTSIIDNANNAVERYNASAGNDQNVLNQVENLFAKYMGGGTTTYTAYEIGDEVSIKVDGKTESFYVLEDSDENTSTVTLLAKYNLDINADATTGKYYQKPNATYSQTLCAFSSENYWQEYTGDLNTYTTDAVAAAANPAQTKANNAIMRARDYAASTIGSGATGRLLTYGEADTLQSSYSSMINGTANTNDGGNYLYYWLSSAGEGCDGGVWAVGGFYGDLYGRLGNDDFGDGRGGVRPVITVSKSLIQ